MQGHLSLFRVLKASTWVISVGLAVGLSSSAGARSDGRDRHIAHWWRAASSVAGWELIHGYPVPIPPVVTPELLRRFHVLWSVYQAVAMHTPISFAEWIAMNGVTDPRECACLMWLYWQGVNRD
jgi:hypothetical protein